MSKRTHARPAAILAALALAATAAVATSGIAVAQKAKCVLAGGEATMITSDLAKFMAGAALKNSISGMGAKAVGPVRMNCKDATAGTYCIARQKACK